MKDAWNVLEVHQLVSEFARRVDHESGRGVDQLFAVDGFYESDGRRTIGRADLRAAYAARAARGPRVARHVFTNLSVTDDALASSSIMTLYARDGSGTLPPRLSLIADVVDRYVRDGDALLFLSRRLTTIFVDGENPPVFPFGKQG